MCIECIITWIVIPVGVAVGLYFWIVKECIVYHKNMCESYIIIEDAYKGIQAQLRGVTDAYGNTLADCVVLKNRMDHIDTWSAKFATDITTNLDRQDKELDKLKGTKKNEPSN